MTPQTRGVTPTESHQQQPFGFAFVIEAISASVSGASLAEMNVNWSGSVVVVEATVASLVAGFEVAQEIVRKATKPTNIKT